MIKKLLQWLPFLKPFRVKVFGRCKVFYRDGKKQVILEGEYQPYADYDCIVYIAKYQEWDSPSGVLISDTERQNLKKRIEVEAPKFDRISIDVRL